MVLAVRLGELTNVWGLPAMQGNVEWGTGRKTRDETGHSRKPGGPIGKGKLCGALQC